jgi:S-formylglutathione hydrolase FrmB
LFASDSWIPTAQSSAAISCKAASGNMATTTQCTATNFASGAGGCSGCMDSQRIITTFAIATTFSADIQTRYPGASCGPFINDLTNTFDNYYNIKNTQYSPLQTRVTAAAVAVNAYKTSITNVGTAFDSVISNF